MTPLSPRQQIEQTELTFNGTTLTINETVEIIDKIIYEDGTILIRVNNNTNTTNMYCSNSNFPELNFKIIKTDGSIFNLSDNIDLRIHNSNYCHINGSDENNNNKDVIRIFPISNSYVLVTYFCEPSSLETCGSIIDWSGKIMSNVTFQDSNCTDSEIVLNINPDTGEFLRVCFISQQQKAKWVKYSFRGSINNLTVGSIDNIYNFTTNRTKLFATEDGSLNSTYTFNLPSSINPNLNYLQIIPLFYGGDMLIVKNSSEIEGIVFDDKRNRSMSLKFNNYIMQGLVGIFPTNNSIWGFNYTTTSWSENAPGNGSYYGNAFIISTSPSINSESGFNITNINITYSIPIYLSTGNISIWQRNGGMVDNNNKDILRQTISGSNSKFFTLSNDSKTIQVTILSSTFNQPDNSYYVLIDDGFVMDGSDLSVENEYNNPDSKSTIIRFTPLGSEYYTSLNKSQKNEFVNQFISQLSSIIPCSPNRIYTRTKYQYDVDLPLKNQILFRVYIREIKFSNGVSFTYNNNSAEDTSALWIIASLNQLIRNKAITGISQNNHTYLLDESYGTVRAQTLKVGKVYDNNGDDPQSIPSDSPAPSITSSHSSDSKRSTDEEIITSDIEKYAVDGDDNDNVEDEESNEGREGEKHLKVAMFDTSSRESSPETDILVMNKDGQITLRNPEAYRGPLLQDIPQVKLVKHAIVGDDNKNVKDGEKVDPGTSVRLSDKY
ncbi:4914_t:CDS:2 [Diversispora eburnea]|uniref:4914_t:CDS:1 n=1 Tax=Diversispora eburnea TaxID=1213867 RepID=A0A9N9FHM9_9GLOM|nr:4914_t:CDS:2 [Diversispora eburnea]